MAIKILISAAIVGLILTTYAAYKGNPSHDQETKLVCSGHTTRWHESSSITDFKFEGNAWVRYDGNTGRPIMSYTPLTREVCTVEWREVTVK